MADVKISALPAATTVAATDVAPIVAGGTVTQKATAAQIVTGGLPAQTGNAGKVLGTNGTNVSWVAGGGGSSLSGVTQSATPFLTALGAGASTTATGLNNTFVGRDAGKVVTSGVNNTFIGAQAGDSVTTGGGNTLVGKGAGSAVTTGANNTIVGNYAGDSATMANNFIAADGAGNRKLQVSNTGAFAVNGGGYGSDGMVMKSNGVGAAAAWEFANVQPIQSITSATSIPVSATSVYFASAHAAGFQITLPDAIANAGFTVTVKRTDSISANTLAVTAVAGLVEGLSTNTIGPKMGVVYCSDGANWWVTASHTPPVALQSPELLSTMSGDTDIFVSFTPVEGATSYEVKVAEK